MEAIPKNRRPKIGLLIPAHNEELVLENTLLSAINAGMKPEHIYVVDDNSNDRTSAIARKLLPSQNVCKVRRSGKGLALTKAIKKYNLCDRYQWIHIADADCTFMPNYFSVFRRNLRKKYAAATGYVKSLPGRHVSQYRVFEYTISLEFHRRVQAMLQVVPVIPGPTSCFRADVLAKINFDNHSLTEDFDVTLQIHRQKLGKIQYIPNAVVYTQDPHTFGDYTKQITRWNRGTLQGIRRHRIGLRVHKIDAYLSYQISQNILFFFNYFIWIPYITIKQDSIDMLAVTFVVDVVLNFVLTLIVAARTKRWDIVSAFPYIYVLRWVSITVFLKAFIEVFVLRKFKNNDGIWSNGKDRRYAIKPA